MLCEIRLLPISIVMNFVDTLFPVLMNMLYVGIALVTLRYMYMGYPLLKLPLPIKQNEAPKITLSIVAKKMAKKLPS